MAYAKVRPPKHSGNPYSKWMNPKQFEFIESMTGDIKPFQMPPLSDNGAREIDKAVKEYIKKNK